MKIIIIILIFSCSLSMCGITNAASFTLEGRELYQKCSSKMDKDVSYCNGYLVGILDGRFTYMIEQADVNGRSPPIGLCIYGIKEITINDLRRAVIRQINIDHQRYDENDGGRAVIDAIKTAFPCKGTLPSMGAGILKKQK